MRSLTTEDLRWVSGGGGYDSYDWGQNTQVEADGNWLGFQWFWVEEEVVERVCIEWNYLGECTQYNIDNENWGDGTTVTWDWGDSEWIVDDSEWDDWTFELEWDEDSISLEAVYEW